MKTLTVRQLAGVKRIAQNVNPLVVKKNKIAAKISKLNAEYNALAEEIEGHEMGVKALTGGLTSEDLVVKKVKKYEPKPGVVVFNEETGVYEIHTEEPTITDTPLEEAVDLDVNNTMDETEVEAGEEAPFGPTNPLSDGTETGNKLPFGE